MFVISNLLRNFHQYSWFFSIFNAALLARLSDKLRLINPQFRTVDFGFWVLVSSSSSWFFVWKSEKGERRKWWRVKMRRFLLNGFPFSPFVSSWLAWSSPTSMCLLRELLNLFFVFGDWAAVDFTIDFDLCFCRFRVPLESNSQLITQQRRDQELQIVSEDCNTKKKVGF